MQAYTQYNDLALLQLVSVTGMWGLSLLMSWLASVVNWAWERDFAWSEIKRGVALYAGILLAVVLFGQVRLWFAPSAEDTVRVAGIVPIQGISTIYPIIGDLFGWLAVLGFVVITIVAIVRWRRAKMTVEPVGVEEELAPAH